MGCPISRYAVGVVLQKASNRRASGSRRGERGQSLVEFALLLPVFLIIFLGVAEFGWALRAYGLEQNAAREGARTRADRGRAAAPLSSGLG